jgi:calcineurin-like phosphoesterase family protein
MKNIFLVSDTHFGHMGVCKFTRSDGVTKLRPWDDPDEMNEDMVEKWNAVVKPTDKVYHLGDVVMKVKYLDIMYRLNGDKVLIRGNHDIFDMKDYAKHFRDIRGCHVVDGLIMTHIPLHLDSMGRFGTNIHGHTHANRVMKARGVDARTGDILYSDEIDPRYISVCVEHTDFAPISFDVVKERIVAQGGKVGFIEKESS